MLGDPGGLTPRSREALLATMTRRGRARTTAAEAVAAARSIRRHELLRIAIADLPGSSTCARSARP